MVSLAFSRVKMRIQAQWYSKAMANCAYARGANCKVALNYEYFSKLSTYNNDPPSRMVRSTYASFIFSTKIRNNFKKKK